MKSLIELSHVSSYRPKPKSLDSKLFNLILVGTGREDALRIWTELGHSTDSFRHSLKKVKDGLVHEAFNKETGNDTTQSRRILCWERYQKIKCLLIADKKHAAIPLAIETITLANKCGFTEISHSLAAELEHHFGAIAPDKQRYLRYRKLRKVSFEALVLEHSAQALFTKLVFYFKSNKNWAELSNEIDKLVTSVSGSSKYMLYRCNTLTIWYNLQNDFEGIIREIRRTLAFFDQSQMYLPYTVKTNLYQQLLPILIGRGHFGEAEKFLGQSLKLPAIGSYNWHILMLQQAYLGFHSNKPKMALNAWKRASQNRKHNTPLIDERWHIVRAYLAIYEKLGHLAVDETFRLARFLNNTHQCQQDKSGDNVAVAVVHLLHLLLDGNHKAYMKKSDPIPCYIQSHLRGKENVRSKCMLYMLKKVEEGDYHLQRTELRAQRWQRLLSQNPRREATVSEVVPFEEIWEMVCSQLK